jgi:hypothetical protein
VVRHGAEEDARCDHGHHQALPDPAPLPETF